VQEELADVLIYLVRLADVLGVDLKAAVEAKLKVNAHKYPIDLAYGNATKASTRNNG
jgi:dCTP diphosphatase